MNTKYIDDKGRLIFISQGIGTGPESPWFTVYSKTQGLSTHRLKSTALPQRDTPEEAQADLDTYAVKKDWKKEEREEVIPLKTFYTKCGQEFQKSTKALVTGYTIDPADKQCADCPFQVDVKEGWPPVHKRWECRAGSQPPNQMDDWIGSVEDKLTIQIRSLHNDFLESILEYCEADPELSASYNQDLEDCRRAISVSCSQNKKGIAAKKALIEKFFPAKAKLKPGAVPTSEPIVSQLSKQNPKCGDCDVGHWYSNDYTYVSVVQDNGNSIKEACEPYTHYCTDFIQQRKKIASDSDFNPEVAPDWCPRKAITEIEVSSDSKCIGCTYLPAKGLTKCNRIGVDREVTENSSRCGWYWNAKTGEMGPLKEKESFPDGRYNHKDICNQCENEDTDCAPNVPEKEICAAFVDKQLTTVNETTPAAFDYSTVDEETAEFLQEKSNNIIRIKMMSMLAVAKELKEAQERLANHNQGTFIAWCESIGYKKSTVYDYLRALDWVVRNSDNGINFEKIQPSLLLVASKKNAPKELQDKVLSGDIDTRKQYEEELKKWQEKAKEEMDLRIEAEKRAEAREKERNFEAEKARNNFIEVQRLTQQLKEKPIETTAVQIQEVEVIPEAIKESIINKITAIFDDIKNLTATEIELFAKEYYSPEKAIDRINASISVLGTLKLRLSQGGQEERQ